MDNIYYKHLFTQNVDFFMLSLIITKIIKFLHRQWDPIFTDQKEREKKKYPGSIKDTFMNSFLSHSDNHVP